MALVLADGHNVKGKSWHYLGIPDEEEEFIENIKHKNDPDFINCYGLSALAMAVRVFQSSDLVEKLLDMGADPNLESYIGRFTGKRKMKSPSGSPLHLAAWMNNSKILEILLRNKANPNAVSSQGYTPLLLVLADHPSMGKRPGSVDEKGALKAVEMLAASGADLCFEHQEDFSLLHLAAKKGYCSIVEHVVTYKGLDFRDSEGNTPLMIAVNGGFYEIVRVLLDRGAALSCKNLNGYTALHFAKNVNVLRILLQRGADVNAKEDSGRTALHFAANVKMARILLEQGANVNAKDNTGQTMLHYAAKNDQSLNNFDIDLINCLVDYNADTNVSDNLGFRPLHLAILGRKECVNTSKIKLLIENGADPFLPDALGRIPVSYFTAFNSEDYVKQISLLLPESKTHRSSKDIFGRPPLHSFVLYFFELCEVLEENLPLHEFEDIIRAFVKSGIEINCQDIGGSTCLHVVAANGIQELYTYSRCGLIRVLLSFGADRNLKDVDGNSPAHIAAQREDWDELRLLTTDNWNDSCNLSGVTVQQILKSKLARNCTNRSAIERFHVIVQEIQDMIEALRNKKSVNVDVVNTLNEKVPEALSIVAFENPKAYPVPMIVRSLCAKDILSTPEQKILITNILHSVTEPEASINLSQARVSENDKSGVLAHRKYEPNDTLQWLPPSLWKQCSSCPIVVLADQFVWEYVRRKSRGLRPDHYIPPAPDAIKHLIRDLPSACKDNTVGEFHFEVQCSHERCEIGRQVRALVTDLVHIMEKLDPRFQSKLHLTGSVPEKTKLWKPDEFDFMVELTKLKKHCKIEYWGDPGSREVMLVPDQEAKEIWKDLTTSEVFESIDVLSPKRFRDYFVLLVWRSGFSLNRAKYKNLSFRLGQYYGQQDGHPLVTLSHVGALLHMQWHGHEFTSLDVNVDLTPSVPFSEAVKDANDSLSSLYDQSIGYHAITAIKPMKGAFWRLSSSLTELSLIQKLSTTQLELYKALKLLRDIHMEEGATSSYALKSIVFNYVFKESSLWDPQQPDELAFHVVSLLRKLQRRRYTNDEIVRSFFTDDIMDNTETWNISTDWIRLSLLEFRKERIPFWFWLDKSDQTSYA